MKRCVVIAGAQINNYDRIKSRLREDDFFVFCDGGLFHMEKLAVKPSLIVGDFDSYPQIPSFENVETIVLPREKDDTDSLFAVKQALKMGFDEFLLAGVLGGRIDHSLGNISILLMLDDLGKKAIIIDDYSETEIVSEKRNIAYIPDSYAYFSLLAADRAASGVCIENAKYPLKDAEFTAGYAYGISNEVISGMTAKVSLKRGRLLLIKIF